jgi:hypothetical protein
VKQMVDGGGVLLLLLLLEDEEELVVKAEVKAARLMVRGLVKEERDRSIAIAIAIAIARSKWDKQAYYYITSTQDERSLQC